MASLLHRPTPLPGRLRLCLPAISVLLICSTAASAWASRPGPSSRQVCARYAIQRTSSTAEPDGGAREADGGGALDGGGAAEGGAALDGGGAPDGGAADASASSGDGGAALAPGSDCYPSANLPNCVCIECKIVYINYSSKITCAMGRGPASGPMGLTPFVLYLLFFLRCRLQAAEHRRA